MKRIYETLKRIMFWGWTMRNSFDWDYAYAEQVLLLKLKRLQHEMNTCHYHRNLADLYAVYGTSEDDYPENTLACIKAYRALNVVIKLLERQQDCDFYGEFLGIYEFMRSYRPDDREDIFSVARKDAIVIPREEYNKKLLTLYEQESRMDERDRRNAYSLISRYSNFWWI